jgi:hypothetical protein
MLARRLKMTPRNLFSGLVFERDMHYTAGMQVARILFAVCTFGLTLSVTAELRQMDHYKSIVDRNPFGLKDPPPVEPAKPKEAPKPPEKKEEFYLTGISTIGHNKKPKAYLLAKDAAKKEYDQKYYNLFVGDRQGDVSLLDVDTKGRRVKIAYLGEEKWLSMEENSVPAPTGPAPGVPGMMPGVPGAPGAQPLNGAAIPVPLPGAAPHPVPQPAPAYNTRRTPRSANNAYNNNYNPGGYSAPMGSMPAPAFNSATAANTSYLPSGPGAVQNAVPVPPGPQTDADVAEQILKMKALEQQRNSSIPMPPTPNMGALVHQ